MSDATANPYDLFEYPGFALTQAHPDRLATLATLFGMTPAEVSHCRVLELGCGDGVNLVGIASESPETTCVGVDLAATGINKGQSIISELGLKNITLQQCDIMNIGREFGQFDFIIAHGLYSWVPAIVRDKILAICKENLTDNGVAYVSYNTYPGCHLRDMMRNMMLYHARDFSDPRQQIDESRALIKFLVEAGMGNEQYQKSLQKELESISARSDYGFFHDDLGEVNAPVYFHQFAEHAARHGLQYLSEADFVEIQVGVCPPHVVEVLKQVSSNRIAQEQYMDFLKGRRFRQTLLCHASVKLNDEPRVETLRRFSISSQLRPEATPVDCSSRQAAVFLGMEGRSLKTENPLMKAALLTLSNAWPHAVHFDDLLTEARQLCGRVSAQNGEEILSDVRVLAASLLRAYAGTLVEFHVLPPCFVAQPSGHPFVSPLARVQAREGARVTNLRHATIAVEGSLERQLLQLLDGSRDRTALLADLSRLVEAGTLTVRKDGEPVTDLETARQIIAAELEDKLIEIGKNALFVA
jgi:methyltransferase-like protein/cyclopropane fatty-acyl-phospholipid synthase-like methyltransferase